MDWWYQHDGNQIGPCSDEEIEQLYKNNELKWETLIRNSNMEKWQPFSKVYIAGNKPKTCMLFVWCMALAAALSGFVNTVIPPSPLVTSLHWALIVFVSGCLFYGFCIMQDMRLLKRQQYPIKKWWLLLTFCPPAYLLVRAYKVDKKYLPAILDCISVLLFNFLNFFR